MNGILILTIVFTLPILVRSQDEETTAGTTATTEKETTTESFTTTEAITTETTAAPTTMYENNINTNHLKINVSAHQPKPLKRPQLQHKKQQQSSQQQSLQQLNMTFLNLMKVQKDYFIKYKSEKLVSSRFNSFVDYSFNIHLHGNSHYPGHLCVLEKVST